VDEDVKTACSSAKRGYKSHDAAMREARHQMGRQRRVILRVYRCKECHLWHMTSSQPMQNLQTLKYLRMRREVLW